MSEQLPGEPDCDVTLTPATWPCRACSIRVGFKASIVSLVMVVTAPVTSFLFCVFSAKDKFGWWSYVLPLFLPFELKSSKGFLFHV